MKDRSDSFFPKILLVFLFSFAWIIADEDCLAPYECCDNDWLSLERFSLGIEGLYFRATQDHLGFARKIKESASANFDNLTAFALARSKKEEFNFKFKPGIRLRLDYQMPCETWDCEFIWTHLLSHTSRHLAAPNLSLPTPTPDVTDVFAKVLTSTFLPPNAFGSGDTNFNKIHAGFRMNFNNFDWLLGKTFEISSCFSLRPFAGLQNTQIAERLHINYKLDPNPLFPSNNFGNVHQLIKTRFAGIGFKGGFDANWYLGCGFAIYSKIDGAIVYGRAHAREKIIENVIFPGAGAEFIELKYRDTFHTSKPNIDLALGLRFDHCFCNSYFVTLKAGWEYHHYFNQNLFRIAQDDEAGSGDLAMHGVTFGAEIQF